jgi:hypothetical protein
MAFELSREMSFDKVIYLHILSEVGVDMTYPLAR